MQSRPLAVSLWPHWRVCCGSPLVTSAGTPAKRTNRMLVIALFGDSRILDTFSYVLDISGNSVLSSLAVLGDGLPAFASV